MRAIEITGDIDARHRLRATVPDDCPEGPVRVLVLVPGEDRAGMEWARSVATEWADELSDPKQDIYTLEDGQPVNAAR